MKTQALIDKVITFDQMSFKLLRELSRCLQLPFSELLSVGPELHPLIDEYRKITGYRVFFEVNAAKEILMKIKGISRTLTVDIDVSEINQSHN